MGGKKRGVRERTEWGSRRASRGREARSEGGEEYVGREETERERRRKGAKEWGHSRKPVRRWRR